MVQLNTVCNSKLRGVEMSIKEALIGVFSDDPINWIKWGIVFAILIGG